MLQHKPLPVESEKNLRERLGRLLRTSKKIIRSKQLSLDLPVVEMRRVGFPTESVSEFLNFITDAVPNGDVYLFGGVIRDVALFGRKGFNSDIDLVVDGCWKQLVPYLDSIDAKKNKFGGYRLFVAGWPVDIWNAEETWAIKEGLVSYQGVVSLTETTVLNWDAILMNWRTRSFIYRAGYFEDINTRTLDVLLEENPNPLGMAVRVFRHLCMKDAKRLTPKAANYLVRCVRKYSYNEIHDAEIKSYRNVMIPREVYNFFNYIDLSEDKGLQHQFSVASNIMMRELGVMVDGFDFE